MAKLLRDCSDNREWLVGNMRHLEAAAALHGPLASARQSVQLLAAKLQKDLLCGIKVDDAPPLGDDPNSSARLRRSRGGRRRALDDGAALHHPGLGRRGAVGGDGAAPQPGRGRRGALDDGAALHHPGLGHRGAHGDGDVHGGVAFADGSSDESTKRAIDDLRDAEKDIRNTKSLPLQRRAKLLADEVKGTCKGLRDFAKAFASLRRTWTREHSRRTRVSWKNRFVLTFDKLQKGRAAVLQRLEALDPKILSFGSDSIDFI
jgi:hypothetical protein